MRLLLFLICMLIHLSGFSQEKNSAFPSAIAGFIPPGWSIGVQEDLLMNKMKTLRTKISTIDNDLQLNGLEKRMYYMTEIDASHFINPFLGDSAFD